MKKYQILYSGFLGVVFTCFFSDNSRSEDTNFSRLLDQGDAEYERQLFRKAADTFSLLVLEYPKCVKCLHMKGKSLGRLAENSSWIKAMTYVPKALTSFETAHRLAPENKAIIQDLITFYERAPFFLGGSLSKAQKLRKRLGEIKSMGKNVTKNNQPESKDSTGKYIEDEGIEP